MLPKSMSYIAIILTFLLIGLWHGPKLAYLYWGLTWSVTLVIAHLLKKHIRVFANSRFLFLKILITLALVIILNTSLVAGDLLQSIKLQKLLLFDCTFSQMFLTNLTAVLFFILPVVLMDLIGFYKKDELFFLKQTLMVRTSITLLILFLLIGGASAQGPDFIYFQF